MEKDIIKAIQYFGFFEYAPLKDEIYVFLKRKIGKITFQAQLASLIKRKKIKQLPISPPRYTLGEYSTRAKTMRSKINVSRKKIRRMGLYISLLSIFSQIKLIGFSGSVAMLNAEKDADVDVFIVTATKRLWTARIIAIGLAKLMKIHRGYDEKHVGDKVCLNLFFDERNVVVPKRKRSEYGAHEVLQMKPQVVKSNSYLSYLDANRWVFDIFPNALNVPGGKMTKKHSFSLAIPIFGDIVESMLKKFQMISISRRKTTEIITDTQLWFFPDDFEKKLASRHKIALNKKSK